MNYRKIWINTNGPIPKDDNGSAFEIHHIDGNRKNNNIENLKCVSIKEHYDIHFKQKDGPACHAIKLRIDNKEPLTGWKHSEETKRKWSETRKGKKHSQETKDKLKAIVTGRKHSEESKKKISDSKKGLKLKPRTAEHQLKITNALKNVKHLPHSEETKSKISKALKGRELTAKTKKLIGEAHKNKKCSVEHKQKISNALKGKPKSREHIEKMSARIISEETKQKQREAKLGKKRGSYKIKQKI